MAETKGVTRWLMDIYSPKDRFINKQNIKMACKRKARCTYNYIKHVQCRDSLLVYVDCSVANMVNNARCAVGYCDNDKRYPKHQVQRSHVEKLVFHKWPKDPALAEIWRKQVKNSRSDDFNPKPGTQGTFVCSNHFPLGKRTPNNPETDYPSVFMTLSEYKFSTTPKKRKIRETATTSKRPHQASDSEESDAYMDENPAETEVSLPVPLQFEQLTRESDVRFYTGLTSTESFKCVFEYLLPKTGNMQYWRGPKQTDKETPLSSARTPFQQFAGVGSRSGPARKLSPQQEFLLCLMRLRLALLVEDLAYRFQVSSTTVSSTFITWIKLMSKELSVLIIWPTRSQIKKTLPSCFRKLYPKVRCIIDCFECFTETPSGLDLAATMWSEYKHHYTLKALVAITPNGAISYISPTYGGRASDIFIVKDSGFLDLLQPFDEVMADRGFKIKEELMIKMCTLCIPPSKAASMQMLPADVRKTSSIANVRIYVEQAIGRMKNFNILKHEIPINLLPLSDDIVQVCCALCNLLPPLCT